MFSSDRFPLIKRGNNMGLFSKIKEGLKKTRDSVSSSIEKMLHSFQKSTRIF